MKEPKSKEKNNFLVKYYPLYNIPTVVKHVKSILIWLFNKHEAMPVIWQVIIVIFIESSLKLWVFE